VNLPIDANELATLANSEIGQETLKEGLAFLARLGGSVLQETGSWIMPEVRTVLALRQIDLALKVKKKLKDRGLPMNAVRWNVLYPLLNAAALQDPAEPGGEEMHERWANLLANESASPGSVSPAFPQTLAQLTHRDANLFEALMRYQQLPNTPDHVDLNTIGYLYADRGFMLHGWNAAVTTAEHNAKTKRSVEISVDTEGFYRCLNNLLRLQLVEEIKKFEIDWDRLRAAVQLGDIFPSEKQSIVTTYAVGQWGRDFYQACQPPKNAAEAN
jgi:hypothetical protein